MTAGSAIPRLRILADDLTGAAEVAGVLHRHGLPVTVSLDGPIEPSVSAVLDLDIRNAPAPRVQERLDGALPAGAIIDFVKIDSQLRGPIAAVLTALHATRPVILAPSLPSLARTVRGGVPLSSGIPLATAGTASWAAEPSSPPASLSALVPVGLSAVVVELESIRGTELRERLSAIARSGAIALCDAETGEDLAAIAAARGDAALVGSSALLEGLLEGLGIAPAPTGSTETIADTESDTESNDPAGASGGVLLVIGTLEPRVQEQRQRLRGALDLSIETGDLSRAERRDSLARSILEGLDAGRTVVVSSAPPLGSAVQDLAVARHLAALVHEVVSRAESAVPLGLIGGETARAVLARLGQDALSVLGEVHPGAPLAETLDGRLIATRPGSFGDADSLAAIATRLRTESGAQNIRSIEGRGHPVTAEATALSTLPLIAVTMGDAAGIGPEIIVRALRDTDTLLACRPFVIGDAARLRLAAQAIGIEVEIRPIERPEDAEPLPGRIDVIDLALIPAELPWGELSPVAGDAAYQYIKVAAELAIARRVDAICTAPLNKEALHAAGHLYPGHTELLARLCGVDEVSMLLSTPKVKVIHVTTHIGLVDAIKRIEPGLVERTIRRGVRAMHDAGIESPTIGVCAINPHAGENGLFGHGEEAEKITPAIELLQAEGLDVRGPLPADTAFFLASRGDYDLIVAMYHDQGHGPVKVLGIEAGVNVTVGLPVIRTSVDHGTAFDIAGTGIAGHESMVEALRQATAMSRGAAARHG